MVKKIIISGLDSDTTYWVLAIQLFDTVGNYIDMGDIIGTPTNTSCQLTNCFISIDKAVYASTGDYSLEKLFQYPRPNTSGSFIASVNKPSTLTIVFDNAIEISKINYILKDSNYSIHTTKKGVTLGAYNSNNLLISEYELNENADNTTGGLDLFTSALSMTIKSLIKTTDSVKTLNQNGEWVDITNNTPSSSDFQTSGISDLSIIPAEKWNELSGTIKILTWTDYNDAASSTITYTQTQYPEKTLELTVPEHRLIDQLDAPISIVTYTDAETVPSLLQQYDYPNIGARILKRG